MVNQKPDWPVLQRGHRQADGLVGAWGFGEGGGDTVYDLAGNNDFPLTTVEANEVWLPGPMRHHFDASGYGEILTPTSMLDCAHITVMVWARWTVSQGGNAECLFSRYGSPARWGLFLDYTGSNDTPRVQIRGGPSVDLVSTSGALNDGEWHHIAFTWDAVELVIYVDGLPAGSSTASSGDISSGGSEIGLATYGAHAAGGELNGDFQQARIYNRALGAAEIDDCWQDSWGLYTPARRIIALAPAAGGVTGSGTASLQGVAISTDAQPAGTFGPTGSGTASTQGVAASGGVGAMLPEGSGTASLSGLAASGAAGTYGPTGASTSPGLQGLAASGGAGTFTSSAITGSGTASLQGLAASGGAGTWAPAGISGAGTSSLQGLAISTDAQPAGTFGPTGTSTSPSTQGLSATGGAGHLPVSGSGSESLQGLAATGGEGTAGTISITSLQGLAASSGVGNIPGGYGPSQLQGLRCFGYGVGNPTTGSGSEALSGLAATDGVGTSTYTVSGSGTAALSGLACVATGKAFVPVVGSGVASLSGLKVPDPVIPGFLGLFCTGTGTFTNPTAPTGSGTGALSGLKKDSNTSDVRPAQTSDDPAPLSPNEGEDASGATEHRFHIGFQYLHEDHVVVLIEGEPVTVGVEIAAPSVGHADGEVVLTEESGYTAGEEVVIMRVTPSANLWNVFVSGADVAGADANAAMKQLLYVAEELELLLKPNANPTVRIPTHIRLPIFVVIIKNPTWYKPTVNVTTTTVTQIMLNLNLNLLPPTQFVFPSSVIVTSSTLLALRNLEGKVRWEGHDVLAGLRAMDPPATYADKPNYKFAQGFFTTGVRQSAHITGTHKTGRNMRAIVRTQTDATSVFLDWWFIYYFGDTECPDIKFTEIPDNVTVDTAAGSVTLGDWDCDRLGLNHFVQHGSTMMCRGRMQFLASGLFTIEDVENPVASGELPPHFRSITPATTSTAKAETLTNWMNDLMGTQDGRPQFAGNDWAAPESHKSGDMKSYGYRHFDVDVWDGSNPVAREAQVFDILRMRANRTGHFVHPYSGKIWESTDADNLILSNAGGFRSQSTGYRDIGITPSAWLAATGENWFNHPTSSQQARGFIIAQKFESHQGTNNQHWSSDMVAMAAYRWNDVALWHQCKHEVDVLLASAPTVDTKGGLYHNTNAARGRGRILKSAALLWHVTKDSRLEEFAAKSFDNMYLTLASNPVNNTNNYQDNGVPSRGDGHSPFEVSFWVMGLRAVLATWPDIRNAATIATLEEELCNWVLGAWHLNFKGWDGYITPYTVQANSSLPWLSSTTYSRAAASQCVAPVQVLSAHYAVSDSAKVAAIIAEWKTARINTTADWNDKWRWLYE